MLVNRSVPPPTVVPVLVYADVRDAVAFLTAAFGFEERTRIGEGHRAQLAVCGVGAEGGVGGGGVGGVGAGGEGSGGVGSGGVGGGDGGAVIVADPGAGRRPPAEGGYSHLTRVRVADADAAFARACAAGAIAVEEPEDRPYGERDCTVEDPGGHLWQLAQTLRDVAPEEYGCQTVSPWPAYQR